MPVHSVDTWEAWLECNQEEEMAVAEKPMGSWPLSVAQREQAQAEFVDELVQEFGYTEYDDTQGREGYIAILPRGCIVPKKGGMVALDFGDDTYGWGFTTKTALSDLRAEVTLDLSIHGWFDNEESPVYFSKVGE